MACRGQEVLFGHIAGFLLIVALTFTLLLEFGIFPTTKLPFDLDDRSISYPVLKPAIGGVVNVVINTVLTVGLMILWLCLHKRTFKNNKGLFILTVYLVLMGAILVNLLTNTIKVYRGGLRPHFIAACKPNKTIVDRLRKENKSWVDLELTKTICTAEGKPDYRWSFPSGHSSEVRSLYHTFKIFNSLIRSIFVIKCPITKNSSCTPILFIKDQYLVNAPS